MPNKVNNLSFYCQYKTFSIYIVKNCKNIIKSIIFFLENIILIGLKSNMITLY